MREIGVKEIVEIVVIITAILALVNNEFSTSILLFIFLEVRSIRLNQKGEEYE